MRIMLKYITTVS